MSRGRRHRSPDSSSSSPQSSPDSHHSLNTIFPDLLPLPSIHDDLSARPSQACFRYISSLLRLPSRDGEVVDAAPNADVQEWIQREEFSRELDSLLQNSPELRVQAVPLSHALSRKLFGRWILDQMRCGVLVLETLSPSSHRFVVSVSTPSCKVRCIVFETEEARTGSASAAASASREAQSDDRRRRVLLSPPAQGRPRMLLLVARVGSRGEAVLHAVEEMNHPPEQIEMYVAASVEGAFFPFPVCLTDMAEIRRVVREKHSSSLTAGEEVRLVIGLADLKRRKGGSREGSTRRIMMQMRRTSELLKCRTQACAERFVWRHEVRIREVCSRIGEEVLEIKPDLDVDRLVQRIFHGIRGRLMFSFPYHRPEVDVRSSEGEKLQEEVLRRILEEERASWLHKYEMQRDGVRILVERVDSFSQRHQRIRERSYPYHWDGAVDTSFQAVLSGADRTVVVGYLQLDSTYVFDVAVSPEYFHQGVAQYLFNVVMESLESETVTLDVRAMNEGAKTLYEKLGFVVVRRTFPGYYDWHGGFKMKAPRLTVIERTNWTRAK